MGSAIHELERGPCEAGELLEAMNRDQYGPDAIQMVARWIGRGSGVAVYLNEAMDSIGLGDVRITSYGDRESQIEPEYCDQDEGGQVLLPPTRLPDIGTQINWRFQLSTYVRPVK